MFWSTIGYVAFLLSSTDSILLFQNEGYETRTHRWTLDSLDSQDSQDSLDSLDSWTAVDSLERTKNNYPFLVPHDENKTVKTQPQQL